MTHAYNELYLRDAMRNLGVMAHYCVNVFGVSAKDFSTIFANSHVAQQLSIGNPRYVTGHSGQELAEILLEPLGKIDNSCTANGEYDITPEYWAGWALAYFQWYCGMNYAQIHQNGLQFDKIVKMYNPLHEADITKFAEIAGEICRI